MADTAPVEDWTWVLERPCLDCRADVLDVERDMLGARFRRVGGSWREVLGRGDVVHRAPSDGVRTWSILEYGCHVRDVLGLLEQRLRLMLKKRKPPSFPLWHDDGADYAEADPDKVAWDLATQAGKVADLLDRVNGAEWDREGLRGDGKRFTVDTLTRYLLHDVEHHLWDAREIIDS